MIDPPPTNPENSAVCFMRKLLILLGFAVSAVNAYAGLDSWGVDLGKAGRTKEWAIFSLGGGVKDTDVTGTADVFGDVGVAGNGDIDLTGDAIIHGDLYYH